MLGDNIWVVPYCAKPSAFVYISFWPSEKVKYNKLVVGIGLGIGGPGGPGGPRGPGIGGNVAGNAQGNQQELKHFLFLEDNNNQLLYLYLYYVY